MDDSTIKALIGGGAALAGGLIGAFIAAFNAKQKIKELEVAHSHVLQETYLANARKHTEEIYLPISLSLTKLSTAYYDFRKNNSPDDALSDEERDAFKSAMTDFVTTIDSLFASGMSAFLTNDLDNQLLSFKNFVQESVAASKPVSKVVISYSVRLFGSNLRSSTVYTVAGKKVAFLVGTFRLSQLGIGIRYSGNEILAAPPDSSVFEERFMRDTNAINYLVKEVTLGAHQPSV